MKAREALQWVAVIGVACIAMAIVIALIGASDTPMIVFWLMGALLCVGCASYMMYRYYQLLTEIRDSIRKLQDDRKLQDEKKKAVREVMRQQEDDLCATAAGIAEAWKLKAMQNIERSIQSGKIDEKEGLAMIQHIQSIRGNPRNARSRKQT